MTAGRGTDVNIYTFIGL